MLCFGRESHGFQFMSLLIPYFQNILCRSDISSLLYPSYFHLTSYPPPPTSLLPARSYLQAFSSRQLWVSVSHCLPFLNRTPDSKHCYDPWGTPLPAPWNSNVPLSTRSMRIVMGKKRQGRIFKEPKVRKIQNNTDD